MPTPSPAPYDAAVIGGGPAGLSAAVWLGRYLHRVVLIDSGDPRNWETRGVNGFLGLSDIRPAQLREAGRDECRKYDVTLIDAMVDTVSCEGPDEFHLGLSDPPAAPALETQPPSPPRLIIAKRMLLAIGLKDVWPDIPGLGHVYGQSAHVCPDCDGYDTRGKKTVILGAGRKAVGMALNLSCWTSELMIVTNGEPAGMDQSEYCSKLDALNIPVLTDRVLKVTSRDGRVASLELEDGKCLDVDKLFFAIGQYPADDLGAQLGCARDDEGHVIVDDHYHTSVTNVWAAGDIVPGPQLAIAAAADGAMAALALHKSLVDAGKKLEPATA